MSEQAQRNDEADTIIDPSAYDGGPVQTLETLAELHIPAPDEFPDYNPEDAFARQPSVPQDLGPANSPAGPGSALS